MSFLSRLQQPDNIPYDLKTVVAGRLPHVSPTVPFMVVWAQKAGCTAVLNWFFHHAGLLDEARAYVDGGVGLNIHTYEKKVFKPGAQYKAALVEQLKSGLPAINFVRCPYERAFSSYTHVHNRWYIGQERKGVASPGLMVRKGRLSFVYGDDVSVEYPISFLDYLQWLADRGVENVDPHHQPQHSEIYKYPNITHYRLEDFTAAAHSIEKEYGLPDSSAHTELFSAPHHKHKSSVSDDVTLRLLRKAIPLNPSDRFQLPKVTRPLLQATEFDELISHLFARDIALYDSLVN